MATISLFAVKNYNNINYFDNFGPLLKAEFAPSVSIIAPAYNEGNTIVSNVRSLLACNYANYNLIIVNDGSKDKSMKKLIDAYELVKVEHKVEYKIPCQKIKGVYKSTNPTLDKLIVVDKVNGGKSDALNAGLNITTNRLVLCVDVDTILEKEVLLRMVKPFLQETEKRVIAVGGVIRIINGCKVVRGKLDEVALPKKRLPKFQVLEYIRTFLLSRMGWGRMNGLLLISGALGMFDREILVGCGGYSTGTVGEDMEVVIRMRRYMGDLKKKYQVVYIPDSLCWTESPETYKQLLTQRDRWARGTIETLWRHRKLFLNPKYGLLGMVSYPYWLIFEWLAPMLEFFGPMLVVIFWAFGLLSWVHLITFLIATYFFVITFSFFAILSDEIMHHQYNSKSQKFLLIKTALTEPFLFHPAIVWGAVLGNFNKLTGKGKIWGNMKRKGF